MLEITSVEVPLAQNRARNVVIYYSGAAAIGAGFGGTAGYLDGKPNNPAEYARYDQLKTTVHNTKKIVAASENTLTAIADNRSFYDPTVVALRQEVASGKQQVASLQAEAQRLDTTSHHDMGAVGSEAAIHMTAWIVVTGAARGLNRLTKCDFWARRLNKNR
ncbi:MAG TPA: hypothetical protein VLF43_05145 [Candidatus Saccharimonadales bacterium]|nr:hypothetical protein [Candidatus Saccharimonadales bacterium]